MSTKEPATRHECATNVLRTRLARTGPWSSVNKAISLHSMQFTFHEQEGNARVYVPLVHIRANTAGQYSSTTFSHYSTFKEPSMGTILFLVQLAKQLWSMSRISQVNGLAVPDYCSSRRLNFVSSYSLVPSTKMSHQLNLYCTRKPCRKCSRCVCVSICYSCAYAHTCVNECEQCQ